MPVFISHSHQDKQFVDQLAANLFLRHTAVWVDRWELKVGDSLVTRIEEAIQGASALLVVLSKAAVESEWCRKELNAGLVRELEERRVIVLPVLLEDCDIPLFLREKKYADFRTDFDSGLREVLEAISTVVTVGRGRLREPEWHADWGIDWGYLPDDRFSMTITVVEQAEHLPFSTVTEIRIDCNDEMTARYHEWERADLGEIGRMAILEALLAAEGVSDLTLVLEDQLPVSLERVGLDTKRGYKWEMLIRSRLLGEDTGKDVALHLGRQLGQIVGHMKELLREFTPEERARMREIISRPS